MARYALVIGIQSYGLAGFGRLQKPVEDAEAIARILEEHGDFTEVTRLPRAWDEVANRYKVAEKPLKGSELGTEIKNFLEQVGTNEALIYFSGHGITKPDNFGNENGYLVTSDCSRDSAVSNGLPLSGLHGLISSRDYNFNSLTLLLDCCHSGSLLKDDLVQKTLAISLQDGRRYFFATACRSHQAAYEGEEYSLFTKAVIKALNQPGIVKTSDLRATVSRELHGSGQEPVFWGEDNITLTYGSSQPAAEKPDDRIQAAIAGLSPDYDWLDQAFFEDVEQKVAKQQARTNLLQLRAANWSMLFQKTYVERDQQAEILEKATKIAQNPEISLLLIRGEPGAGKTALLRWLAYQLVLQGERVLHKKSQGMGWLEQLRNFSGQLDGQHFYVIADDLFRDEAILEELQGNEFLFLLTVIATTRLNEDRGAELEGLGYGIDWLDLARPSNSEKERILALPEVQSHSAGKSQAEQQQLMNSPIMLVLMLQLSEGKPFDQVLWDIVKALPNTDRQPLYQAFGVLCSFFQYGIVVPFEILQLCLPAPHCSERLVLEGLAGVIDVATYGGYEGLTTVHELIAKTVMELRYRPGADQNQPYGWMQNPSWLEQQLRTILPGLDGTQETAKRWLYHSLRLLAVNGAQELVKQLLKDYDSVVEKIQSHNTISAWSYWVKIYQRLGWATECQRCVDGMLRVEPVNGLERTYQLSLISKQGSQEQLQQTIKQTASWLDQHPEDRHVRCYYLVLLGRVGSREQQQRVIKQITTWLDEHPDDGEVRGNYLRLVSRVGSRDQKQQAIEKTAAWLDKYPENREVCRNYLALLGRFDGREQQQRAIKQTATWLDEYPEDFSIRVAYLTLLSRASSSEQLINYPSIESIANQQWQWINQQNKVGKNLWNAFLMILYNHQISDLYQEAIQLALQQYPESSNIISQVFGYFRDYLDYESCNRCAIHVSQVYLPPHKWRNYIYAANFFRDHNQLKKAESLYLEIIKRASERLKRSSYLSKTINFSKLSYSQLLLMIDPPQPDCAIQNIKPTLDQNPQHGYAHFLMAQAYQVKGVMFYVEARNYFESAIRFDSVQKHQKQGFFYHQFGCFYRYAIGNLTNARQCFEQSLQQAPNFPAYLELAELAANDGNIDRATTLLRDGLALPCLTRPEREEREKCADRINTLRQQLNLPPDEWPPTQPQRLLRD